MIGSLNEQQQAAVTLPEGHALVLAGAGSGKTRVLTTRMAWLIQTSQVSPFGLLAVTFTNKSAREMLTRLSSLLPINTRGMWVGTFHGLCNRLLRAHHRDAGLPQTFQILDSADQLSAIKRLIKAAGIDDDKYPPRDVQRFINGSKEQGLRPDLVDAWDAHRRGLISIYEQYQAQCEREGVVDFAELLLRAYELLSRNAPIREHYQRRFQHILIDEFQDTNDLQYRWLKLLAGGGASLFAVGDDDQSIYAFRGANVGNMAAFERDYAKGNVIRLEQNYRSHGHILDSANALIAHNAARLGKNLWTEEGEGEPVRVCEQGTDLLEAQWVVDEIKSLVNDGHTRSDIAVLYRSNAQSRVIEHALFSSGLPYKVYGGLRFFERQEVKHALAYLRLITNPNDDTSWLRVVNFPARGIGARTLEQLGDAARAAGSSLYGAVDSLSGKSGLKLQAFAELLAQLTEQAHYLPLPEIIEHVVHHSGLRDFYMGEKEGEDRLENLQELVNAAAVFVGEEGMVGEPALSQAAREAFDPLDMAGPPTMSPLDAFLSHASLEAGDNQARAGEDAIQLMTVHAAKGLEFDSVFMTGLEEGLFPHENSLTEQGGLEEERRLMYVAMTRARKRLYLTLAQSRMLHGQTRYAMRSRFLEEIPDAHLKWLTPKVSTMGAAMGSSMGSSWSGGGYRRGDAYNRPSTGAMSPREPRLATSGVTVGEKLFRIGQGVHHAKFGDGTIIGLSGMGNDAQAQIQFRDVGTKTLALGVAKLDIVSS
ncbi:UvrD-helicase domain-containing protein [Pusillimonas sp. DMV24BSW_D]|uniref:UvrD-helicase domain-containing protein n=1 Tax=Neopusillimonas aestuarii TaxID=2716226 RepID=UPI001408DD22|nr:UvrD-helicase domain-containing protein [Pusillimonas sp. DMV24BSW_D]QIM49457.1 UvrD-helicase domain-containing protein [Pusillimonas sp. DMV24BSW_D]